MEQTNQPRGAANENTTHDEPVIYNSRTTEAPLLLTFAEAEQHNAYTLLTELHDHALTLDAEGRRPTDPRHHPWPSWRSALPWWPGGHAGNRSLCTEPSSAVPASPKSLRPWAPQKPKPTNDGIGGPRANPSYELVDRLSVEPAEVESIRSRLGKSAAQ
jgi:hypothetical protein